MALTDKLNVAHADLVQAQKVSSARALMQPIRADVIRVNAELQDIADTNNLDDIDPEIKQALVAAWNIIKSAETAFEDPIVTELLDWRPV